MRVVTPFVSLTKELKVILEDPLARFEDLENELKKLKYSNSMKKSAKYHWRALRNSPTKR
jgi:hypothetical protein